MDFINDNILQIFKQLYPLGVMRHDPGMKHIGIGYDNVPCLPDGLPGTDRGIPVISIGFDGMIQHIQHPVQFTDLILGKCFCGKQIQGPGIVIPQYLIDNREIIAKGFPGRRRGNHHNILSLQHQINRPGLVRVQLMNVSLFQNIQQFGLQAPGEGTIGCFPGRNLLPPGNVLHNSRIMAYLIHQLIDIHDGIPSFPQVIFLSLYPFFLRESNPFMDAPVWETE